MARTKGTNRSRRANEYRPRREVLEGPAPRYTHMDLTPYDNFDESDPRHPGQIPPIIPLPNDPAFSPFVPGVAWEQQKWFVALTDVNTSAVGKTQYDEEPPKGLGDNDHVRTSFVPGQAQTTKFYLPEIMYMIHVPEERLAYARSHREVPLLLDSNNDIVYEQWPIVGDDGIQQPARPLRDFPGVPITIGSGERWWRIELWRRLYPNMRMCDLLMRFRPDMPQRTRHCEQRLRNVLNMRCSRTTYHHYGMISWHGKGLDGKSGGCKMRKKVLSEYSADALARNSSRGFAPGLIDPTAGENPQNRIPLPPKSIQNSVRVYRGLDAKKTDAELMLRPNTTTNRVAKAPPPPRRQARRHQVATAEHAIAQIQNLGSGILPPALERASPSLFEAPPEEPSGGSQSQFGAPPPTLPGASSSLLGARPPVPSEASASSFAAHPSTMTAASSSHFAPAPQPRQTAEPVVTPFGLPPMTQSSIQSSQPCFPDSFERFTPSLWDDTAADFRQSLEQPLMTPFGQDNGMLRADNPALNCLTRSFPLPQGHNLPALQMHRVITVGYNTYLVYTDSRMPFQIVEGVSQSYNPFQGI